MPSPWVRQSANAGERVIPKRWASLIACWACGCCFCRCCELGMMPNRQGQQVTGETEGSGSSLVTWSCDATWDHALHMKSDLQFGRSQRPGRAFAVALSLMVAFAEPSASVGGPSGRHGGWSRPLGSLSFAATWLRLTRVRANTRKTRAQQLQK